MKRELLYPNFLLLMQMTEDYFWKNVFEDMAYGVSPYGTSMHNGTLYCNIKDKQFCYVFAGKPQQEVFDTLLHYFRTKLSLTPGREYTTVREAMEQQLQLRNYTSWKEIRKKNIRNILIVNYVLQFAKRCGFTMLQTQKLMNIVSVGFAFKFISNDDIVYDAETQRVLDIQWNDQFKHKLP